MEKDHRASNRWQEGLKMTGILTVMVTRHILHDGDMFFFRFRNRAKKGQLRVSVDLFD